jgi:hypothetical protein
MRIKVHLGYFVAQLGSSDGYFTSPLCTIIGAQGVLLVATADFV